MRHLRGLQSEKASWGWPGPMAEAYITAGKKVEGVYSRELSLNRLYVVPHVQFAYSMAEMLCGADFPRFCFS